MVLLEIETSKILLVFRDFCMQCKGLTQTIFTFSSHQSAVSSFMVLILFHVLELVLVVILHKHVKD